MCFNRVSEAYIPKPYWNVWKIAIGYQSISFLCVSIGFPKPTSPKHYWNVWKIDVECQNIKFICVSIRFPEIPPQKTIETGGLLTWQHWISQDEPRPNQFHATETLLQNEPLFQSVSRRWLLAMMKSDFLMRKTPCFELVSFVSIRFPKPASPKHNWNAWKNCYRKTKTLVFYVFQ